MPKLLTKTALKFLSWGICGDFLQDLTFCFVSGILFSIMEKLLKYPIDTFNKGNFFFSAHMPALIILIIFAALVAVTILAYRRVSLRTNPIFNAFLIALRAIVLIILFFCILKPIVTIPQTNPEESYLLVLVDDSKSMQIKDCDEERSRKEAAYDVLYNPEKPEEGLINRLSEKFKTRLFAFSSGTKRIGMMEKLKAEGEYTDIPASISKALEDLKGVPLSGVVLITDGADKSGEDIAKLAYQMRERKVPVHTVGIGSLKGVHDLELVKVDAPRYGEEDFPVEIWVTVSRMGYPKRKVKVTLTGDDGTKKDTTVNLDEEHPSRRIPIRFLPRSPGTHKYVVKIETEKDEVVPQNNSKRFLLKVAASKKVKILYVDGSPRWELKHIKRALENDPNIELVARVKTAIAGQQLVNTDRYWGQGKVKGKDKLEGIYPLSKEALFDYDGIIFGNIDASEFTEAQLENTEEFVKSRGGGFLMLGGSKSLSSGSYLNTPIAKMLPVELEGAFIQQRMSQQQIVMAHSSNTEFLLTLTPEGKISPLMRIGGNVLQSENNWKTLPSLIGYSPVKRAKPGATVFAAHPTDRNEFGKRILVATQNYGSGRSIVFTPNSSWRWSMLTEQDDERHERFWRQIARWLTTMPKERLKLQIAKNTYRRKEPVLIDVTAYDTSYKLTNHASVRAIITDKDGNKKELYLEQVLGKEGLYRARFVPQKQGEYTVDVIGLLNYKPFGQQRGLLEVAESYEEFTRAELNSNLLSTLARISNGRNYTIEDAPKMADEISLVKSATSVMVDEELWDMPLLFLLIAVFLTVEWFLRKRKGLA